MEDFDYKLINLSGEEIKYIKAHKSLHFLHKLHIML